MFIECLKLVWQGSVLYSQIIITEDFSEKFDPVAVAKTRSCK